MSTPHLRTCPKVDCTQKNDCCPFRKIVIPAVMGDDSEGSEVAPENGAYRNALVVYEANGAMYIYASDGIWTKMSAVADGHGAATIAYVDSQDAAVLADAKAYADSVIPEGEVSKTYVDNHDAATLSSSKDYTDSVAFLTLGNEMTIAAPVAGTSVSASFSTTNNSITMSNSNGDTVTTPTKTSDLANDSNFVASTALATVATTGSYNDLLDRPSIPTSQVQSDWAQLNSAEPDFIKNKPALSAVAISGSYTDLLNQPTIPAAQVNSDWNAASGISQILNKPNLATVATSGSYNDLSNKPTIPAAQVNSDWNAGSGVAQILNKPAIPVITMQSSDPGEGAALAANNFIAVYVSGS
jgi:hypothetical protein